GHLHLVKRQIAQGAALVMHERLPAGIELGYQGHRDLGGAIGKQTVQQGGLHSSASSQICSLPPQARPTCQACSLVTPKSSSRAFPPAITSCASRTAPPPLPPLDPEPII